MGAPGLIAPKTGIHSISCSLEALAQVLAIVRIELNHPHVAVGWYSVPLKETDSAALENRK